MTQTATNDPDSDRLTSDECGLIIDALRQYGRAYWPDGRCAKLADRIATTRTSDGGVACRMCGTVLVGDRKPGMPHHRCWSTEDEDGA